jgi:hypothetical protein
MRFIARSHFCWWRLAAAVRHAPSGTGSSGRRSTNVRGGEVCVARVVRFEGGQRATGGAWTVFWPTKRDTGHNCQMMVFRRATETSLRVKATSSREAPLVPLTSTRRVRSCSRVHSRSNDRVADTSSTSQPAAS